LTSSDHLQGYDNCTENKEVERTDRRQHVKHVHFL